MAVTELQLFISASVGSVSAILVRPSDAWLLYVMAHGAGAGMRHPFMQTVAENLGSRGVATFRYNFPYVDAGRKRPDHPAALEAAVAAAAKTAAELAPNLPLIAGGKSLGGRMSSGAAASGMLPQVRGLVFLGFPLHAPAEPGTGRADHLGRVNVPMLFLQGTGDAFARLDLLTQVCGRLPRATLHLIEGGDHSFNVPKRSGRTKEEILDELSSTLSKWDRAEVLGTVPS